MRDILFDFTSWYLTVQLLTLVALPLTLRFFSDLPDRGYAFAKSVGVISVGFVLWLGASYGILRNESGGAWLAVLIVAGLSAWIGWPVLSNIIGDVQGNRRLHMVAWGTRSNSPTPKSVRNRWLPGWRIVLVVEVLFVLAFLAWTLVRAHDPAINHTEQPMDLMFMNGIWTSPTYPPRDPWLAGYAISYYYFGYWLLATVARLAAQPPEIAYNLGQACWFGLLLIGSFGIGYNLASYSVRRQGTRIEEVSPAGIGGGLLTTITVGLTGNLHVIQEWLYAQGVNVGWLANWSQVHNFPEQASISNQWYIDAGWSWWWRASRVVSDSTLTGEHIEIIDEFPIFSYILGDNHPHVLAMPFVLLVAAMALTVFIRAVASEEETLERSDVGTSERLAITSQMSSVWHIDWPTPWTQMATVTPLGAVGAAIVVVATGAIVFLNTWDFPPYWLLMGLAAAFALRMRGARPAGSVWRGVGIMATILAGTLLVFFPYFLTAQSQAGGVLPNFFNPTRLPQFLLMFGHLLLAVIVLLLGAWRAHPVDLRTVLVSALLVFGLPLLFLATTLTLATTTQVGRAALEQMALPPGAESYVQVILERWTAGAGQPALTFLLSGTMLSVAVALVWKRLVQPPAEYGDHASTFALLLAGIGLALIYTPEFVYLRDNFGNRMNTVFKFYYQGWLLLGVAGSYGIVRALTISRSRERVGAVLAGFALLLILAGMIYPVAGAKAKVTGFGTMQPTLDGLAYVPADERAAMAWIRNNTAPEEVILQARGRSYSQIHSRVSASTGRATLLGWDGHESQWRGPDYGDMAAGRPEAISTIYQGTSGQEVEAILAQHGIDYVYVGPVEREQYALGRRPDSAQVAHFAEVMDLVFEQGNVQIYGRR